MERVNEHDLAYRNGDHGPKCLFRGPHHEWGVILLRPGDALGTHRHAEVEETFYFECGHPTLHIAGQAHAVEPGDVFRLEPGESHKIVNDGEEPTRVIFIKCPYLPEDKEDIPG
jgi:mannose-6-phosphate isomerase-like protein (cupin superfamily)